MKVGHKFMNGIRANELKWYKTANRKRQIEATKSSILEKLRSQMLSSINSNMSMMFYDYFYDTILLYEYLNYCGYPNRQMIQGVIDNILNVYFSSRCTVHGRSITLCVQTHSPDMIEKNENKKEPTTSSV